MPSLIPEDVGQGIVARLEREAILRNQAKSNLGKIGVSYQVDDPKKPGIFKIDVDAPAPPSSEESSIFLARLEIHLKTGDLEFFPTGYPPVKEVLHLGAYDTVLEQMIRTIYAN